MKKYLNKFTSIISTLLFIGLMSVAVLIPSSVLAQGQAIQGPVDTSVFTLQNPLNAESIGGLVKSFVEILSYLAIILAVLVIIYIGFSFVMARGKPEETKRLKAWLGWTVIGVAVIIGARIIVDVVINTLDATNLVSPDVTNSVKKANK